MLKFNLKNLLLFMLVVNHATAGSEVSENTVKFKYGSGVKSVGFEEIEENTNDSPDLNDATGKLLQDVESRNARQQLILSVSAAKVAKKETADEFNNQVNYRAIAIDRVSNALPKKLHFFVKGELKIDQVKIGNVLLGQGKSGLLSNNWWFGAPNGIRHSSGYAMTLQGNNQKYCVYTYDSNVFRIAKDDCNQYDGVMI